MSQVSSRESSKTALLKEYFGQDGLECSTSISTRCPVNLSLMRMPAKGVECTHLAFFCLFNLVMLYATPSADSGLCPAAPGPVKCPICNRRLTFQSIRISRFLYYIIKEVGQHQKSSGVQYDSVYLSQNGNWRASIPPVMSP